MSSPSSSSQQPSTTNTTSTPAAETESTEKSKISFKCSSCHLDEKCDYFGRTPPFARKVSFTEDCYVMIDPFSPPPSHETASNLERFLIVGSDCGACERPVCRGAECSFFYYKTFCLACANNNVKQFPLDVQSKIKKAAIA